MTNNNYIFFESFEEEPGTGSIPRDYSKNEGQVLEALKENIPRPIYSVIKISELLRNLKTVYLSIYNADSMIKPSNIWDVYFKSIKEITTYLASNIDSTTEEQISYIIEEKKKKLRTQLLFSFEDKPIENGMHHPAERVLLESIDKNPIALNLIEIICLDDTIEPHFLADLLKCLGRIDYEKVKSVAKKIVERTLAHTDIRVRDATVYAIEHWGNSEMKSILKGYAAGEKKEWLRRYMEKVADDLSED